MAILASAIYHHFPEYYELFSAKTFTFDGHTFGNHNHLLKHFKGADGMKTGYTRLAGYNIVIFIKFKSISVEHETLFNRFATETETFQTVCQLVGEQVCKCRNKHNEKCQYNNNCQNGNADFFEVFRLAPFFKQEVANKVKTCKN